MHRSSLGRCCMFKLPSAYSTYHLPHLVPDLFLAEYRPTDRPKLPELCLAAYVHNSMPHVCKDPSQCAALTHSQTLERQHGLQTPTLQPRCAALGQQVGGHCQAHARAHGQRGEEPLEHAPVWAQAGGARCSCPAAAGNCCSPPAGPGSLPAAAPHSEPVTLHGLQSAFALLPGTLVCRGCKQPDWLEQMNVSCLVRRVSSRCCQLLVQKEVVCRQRPMVRYISCPRQ